MMDQPTDDAMEPIDEVQQLVWSLLDENISDQQFTHLQDLLETEDSARETYIQCTQLHADLHTFFNERSTTLGQPASEKTKSPVLGFLNDGATPLPTPSPEESGS